MRSLCSLFLSLGLALILSGCGQSGVPIKISSSPADNIAKQAETALAEGKKLEAKAFYQQIIADYSDYKDIESVQDELYKLNMEILFSDMPAPQTVIHEVVAGDTLGKIAKQYNETMDLIKLSNGLKSDNVRLGQRLRIWKGKFSIFVDKSQNILLLKSDGEVLKSYRVSTGANNSTPVGTFQIVVKLVDPVWYKNTGAVVPQGSPDNALGSRWMGFDKQGYGIHGTIEPDKIGQQITSGCVRMRNADVEELFSIAPRNTEVTIVD